MLERTESIHEGRAAIFKYPARVFYYTHRTYARFYLYSSNRNCTFQTRVFLVSQGTVDQTENKCFLEEVLNRTKEC